MNRQLLVHGAWVVVALTSFVIGAKWFPAGGRGEGDSPPLSDNASAENLQPDLGAEGPAAGSSKDRRGLALALTETGGGAEMVPLSEAQIEQLGETFRMATSPVERRLAFSRLLEGLTADNALAVREQIEHMPHHSAEFREFHYAWGAVAGAEAIEFGIDTEEDDMSPALAGWASDDPSAALAWFKKIDIANDPNFEPLTKEREIAPDQLQNHIMRGLVEGLADADPIMASEFLVEAAGDGNRTAFGMMHMVASEMIRTESPKSAAIWAEALPEGHLRNVALGRVADQYAKTDLEAAVAWAEGFASQPENGGAIAAVGSQWAARDPEAAVEWLRTIPDGKAQHAGLSRAMHQWAGRDAMAASQFLADMPASQARDAAVAGFTQRLAWEDPESAIVWAESITSEEPRNRALIGAARAWHRKDARGAADWVESAGLSESARQAILNPKAKGDQD